jgi:hypothetical protein
MDHREFSSKGGQAAARVMNVKARGQKGGKAKGAKYRLSDSTENFTKKQRGKSGRAAAKLLHWPNEKKASERLKLAICNLFQERGIEPAVLEKLSSSNLAGKLREIEGLHHVLRAFE